MSDSPSLRTLLDLAVEAACLGGKRTLAYFNAGVDAVLKPDGTPVTAADQEAEQLIVRQISRYFPDHAILGEESGAKPPTGGSDIRWIIDPLDGTKTFLQGVPLYGTLIGVEIAGRVDVGVMYFPAINELICAARGLGCRWNGRAARVSQTRDLKSAIVLCTDDASGRSRGRGYESLVSSCKYMRTWGDCYGYALITTGRADVMIDPRMNPWDCAALLPCLEEAGGRFTDWQGKPTIWGNDAVGTNGVLHETVIKMLATD